MTEAAPTASPPKILKTMNWVNDMTIPDPQAETIRRTAEIISMERRPYESANLPAKNAPIAHPNSMEATLNQVQISSALKATCNPFIVPLMTPLSNPRRKPPSVATRVISII